MAWRPDTFVSDTTRGICVLTARLHRAVSEFCRNELEREGLRTGPGDDDQVVRVAAALEGLESAVVCEARRSDLLALCAAALGGKPERRHDRPNARVLEFLVNSLAGCFLDVFCKAAVPPGEAVLTRRPQGLAEGQPAGPAKDMARLPISIADYALNLEYQIDAADLRRLLVPSTANPAVAWPGDVAVEFRKYLEQTDVVVEGAVLDRGATLGEIRSWRVGSIVPLTSTPKTNATLDIGGRPLFRCEIARDEEFFALRVLGVSVADGGEHW